MHCKYFGRENHELSSGTNPGTEHISGKWPKPSFNFKILNSSKVQFKIPTFLGHCFVNWKTGMIPILFWYWDPFFPGQWFGNFLLCTVFVLYLLENGFKYKWWMHSTISKREGPIVTTLSSILYETTIQKVVFEPRSIKLRNCFEKIREMFKSGPWMGRDYLQCKQKHGLFVFNGRWQELHGYLQL